MHQFAAALFTVLAFALMAAPAESAASLEEVKAQIHKGGSGDGALLQHIEPFDSVVHRLRRRHGCEAWAGHDWLEVRS